MRKLLAIIVALALILGLAFVLSILAASELGGEVVTLRTVDAQGHTQETSLWIVEDQGFPWLRAGVPSSGWLQRIEVHPEVEVERGGRTLRFRAVPVRDPAIRDRIHALMREKYGAADAWISIMRDGEASVPVRLEPAEGPSPRRDG